MAITECIRPSFTDLRCWRERFCHSVVPTIRTSPQHLRSRLSEFHELEYAGIPIAIARLYIEDDHRTYPGRVYPGFGLYSPRTLTSEEWRVRNMAITNVITGLIGGEMTFSDTPSGFRFWYCDFNLLRI